MKTELPPILASAKNLDHIRLCIYDSLQGVFTQDKFSTSKHRYNHRRTQLETSWKKHRHFIFSLNSNLSFMWLQASIYSTIDPHPLYVVTVISKNITTRAYAVRTVLKKLNLIMMESRKGKTWEVTRNTCNTTEHHLQELTGSKIWW